MKKIKKVLALLCMITFSITIFNGCSKEYNSNHKTEEVIAAEITTMSISATKQTVAEKVVKITKVKEETETEKIAKDIKEMRNISSKKLVKEMKIGWNLGDTMDCYGRSDVTAETYGGNPKATQKLIDKVKASGFNVLRIPTTWYPHLGPAPDYTIDPAWLKRVKEIVDYGISDGMFVILNAHNENWYYPSYENEDKAKEILEKVWKQIADEFEDYDEHLIFEGLNEPRQIGASYEWTGGNKEGRDVVNHLNAVFVQTIRNSGGNNPLRHLMIPTYAASGSNKTWVNFKIPDNKIIVSIHAYIPMYFAMRKNNIVDWSSSDKEDIHNIDYLLKSLKETFISKGIPVVIGEFGAINKNNTQARVAWAEYYIEQATKAGIPCLIWDNGKVSGDGQLYGNLDRYKYYWHFPEIITALMKGLSEGSKK